MATLSSIIFFFVSSSLLFVQCTLFLLISDYCTERCLIVMIKMFKPFVSSGFGKNFPQKSTHDKKREKYYARPSFWKSCGSQSDVCLHASNDNLPCIRTLRNVLVAQKHYQTSNSALLFVHLNFYYHYINRLNICHCWFDVCICYCVFVGFLLLLSFLFFISIWLFSCRTIVRFYFRRRKPLIWLSSFSLSLVRTTPDSFACQTFALNELVCMYLLVIIAVCLFFSNSTWFLIVI